MQDSSNEPQRALTYGEQAVGITFNPANDPTVQKLKELYAQIIDICDVERNGGVNKGVNKNEMSGEKKRLLSVAITEAQTAQMWAVKGVTYRN